MDKQQIEASIVELLRGGPMYQVDIVDRFPLDRYLDVAAVLRDMAAREVVIRESYRRTYLVRLAGEDVRP